MYYLIILFSILTISCSSSIKQSREVFVVSPEPVEQEEQSYPLFFADKTVSDSYSHFEEEDEEIELELNDYFEAFQTEEERDFFDLGKKAPDINVYFGWPLSSKKVSSHFGYRIHPISKKRLMHNGVDFKASKGSPIYAINNGTVIISKKSSTYGNVIAVSHSGGFVSLYAHNDSNLVKKGDTVLKNQKIGLVGSTGRTTGSHLHFELRKNKQNIDPYKFLMNQGNK